MSGRSMDDQLVIGLTGPIGSGCSTVASLLADQKFWKTSVSKPIKEALSHKVGIDAATIAADLSEWRQKLQDLGDDGRQEDKHKWIKAALLDAPDSGDLVIDGIRNLEEVRYLRKRYHTFFLAAIHADRNCRWNRVRQLYNGKENEFDRDDRRDAGGGESYGQQVAKCVQDADLVINNSDDLLEDSRSNRLSEKLLTEIGLMRSVHDRSRELKLRPPSSDEGHMAAAYGESHLSMCLKRHVGALIVSKEGFPLSLGYNENPRGMKDCLAEYSTCFKDDVMHTKLRNMRGLFCPACGEKIEQLDKPWLCPKCREDVKLRMFPDRNLGLCTAVHAEERAILSLEGRKADGGTIYTTTFPCFQCARKVVDCGLSRVVFVEAYPIKEALEFLEKRGLQVRPFEGFKARAFNLIFRQVE